MKVVLLRLSCFIKVVSLKLACSYKVAVLLKLGKKATTKRISRMVVLLELICFIKIRLFY